MCVCVREEGGGDRVAFVARWWVLGCGVVWCGQSGAYSGVARACVRGLTTWAFSSSFYCSCGVWLLGLSTLTEPPLFS